MTVFGLYHRILEATEKPPRQIVFEKTTLTLIIKAKMLHTKNMAMEYGMKRGDRRYNSPAAGLKELPVPPSAIGKRNRL